MTTNPWRTAVRFLALTALLVPAIAACATGGGLGATVKRGAFTSSEYGVAVSPRVTNNPNPPRGGGRYQVGKPYTVKGVTYTPQQNPAGYTASGKGSLYGSDFHGRYTANGEIFSANAITGAHPTLPLPSYVRVTNQENGRSIIVRVNDRGPYLPGRVMDLSYRAAAMLGYVTTGSASIQVDYVGPAPLEGDDTRTLVASYNGPSNFDTGNTQVASADSGRSLVGMTSNFLNGLFSYAEPSSPQAGAVSGSAQAAADAMASNSALLTPPGAAEGAVHIGLGVHADAARAASLAQQFAFLGAVTEESVSDEGCPATQLTLTHLKPGVAKDDVLALGRELGLEGIIQY